MRHRIESVVVKEFPVLSVTFDDKLSGEIDMRQDIENKPIFAELSDPIFFKTVAIGRSGTCLGWKLDQTFNEIDLSADGLRNAIEIQIVQERAKKYRSRMKAAE